MLRSKVPTLQSGSTCSIMRAFNRPVCISSDLRPAVRLLNGRQQHGSRVLLCTAVLSGSGRLSSSSRSGRQPLRQWLGTNSSSAKQLSHSSRFSSMRRRVMPPLAMVNVDFASPSLVLGVTLIGCGIALLQVRNMQREVSRDADIVVAAMISIVGSTLIFQGWRLDPLLLLCQALTTSVAFWYGLEAFKLRAEVVQEEDADLQGQQMPPLQDMPGVQQQDFNAARPGYLPQGADRSAPWAQQQQQQQSVGGYGPGSNARWGLPPGQQSMPYNAFSGSSNGMAGAPEAAYAGDQEASSSGQQQYIPGAGGYGSSGSNGGGYGNGMYDAAGAAGVYNPQQPGQQQQQPQQYEWPAESYGQQPMGPPYMQQQQQPVWYDAAGVSIGLDGQPQQQSPYSGFPGLADPYMPGAVPAAGLGALPDGSLLPGAYGTDDGLGLPLAPPAEQQQQQQPGRGQPQQRRGQGGGRNAYEQVDDWE